MPRGVLILQLWLSFSSLCSCVLVLGGARALVRGQQPAAARRRSANTIAHVAGEGGTRVGAHPGPLGATGRGEQRSGRTSGSRAPSAAPASGLVQPAALASTARHGVEARSASSRGGSRVRAGSWAAVHSCQLAGGGRQQAKQAVPQQQHVANRRKQITWGKSIPSTAEALVRRLGLP